jgi:hypothetical protein
MRPDRLAAARWNAIVLERVREELRPAAQPAAGATATKRPSPLNAPKDTYGHSCCRARSDGHQRLIAVPPAGQAQRDEALLAERRRWMADYAAAARTGDWQAIAAAGRESAVGVGLGCIVALIRTSHQIHCYNRCLCF